MLYCILQVQVTDCKEDSSNSFAVRALVAGKGVM